MDAFDSDTIELGFGGLLRQAHLTADDYFTNAQHRLQASGLKFTAADVIALAAIAAQDFETTSRALVIQQGIKQLRNVVLVLGAYASHIGIPGVNVSEC